MSDILVHVPEYGVAICSKCQYAVQPAGLSKHLLRHGIYRNERYAQVEHFRKLNLLEPEDVPLPLPDSDPIPRLPVYQGRRCLADDCSYICISEKRMQQHSRECHNTGAVHERPSCLQTFFRGNKLQYFEVKHSAKNEATPGTQRPIIARGRCAGTLVCKVEKAESKVSNSREALDNALLNSFDFDAMKLMHHCTATTCLSLGRGTESAEFLRSIITREAFEKDYLLHALLSFTALHLATTLSDVQMIQKYRKLSTHYQALALPRFREALSNPSVENANALVMCSRITTILSQVGAHLKWKDGTHGEDINPEEATNSILSSLSLLRGSVSIWRDLQSLLPQNSEFMQHQQSVCDVEEIEESLTPSVMSCRSPFSSLSSLASMSSDSLVLLGEDSLTALQDHFSFTIASEDLKIASLLTSAFGILKKSLEQASCATCLSDLWTALEMWPCLLPTAFIYLLASRHPTALLIYAHWLLIIKKLEPHHWFFKGQTEQLLHSIASLLDKSHLYLLPALT